MRLLSNLIKVNESISIIEQEMNLNLLTIRQTKCKDHTKFFRLVLLLFVEICLNPDPTPFWKPGQFSKNKCFTLFI